MKNKDLLYVFKERIDNSSSVQVKIDINTHKSTMQRSVNKDAIGSIIINLEDTMENTKIEEYTLDFDYRNYDMYRDLEEIHFVSIPFHISHIMSNFLYACDNNLIDFNNFKPIYNECNDSNKQAYTIDYEIGKAIPGYDNSVIIVTMISPELYKLNIILNTSKGTDESYTDNIECIIKIFESYN